MAAWLTQLRPKTLEYRPVCPKQTPHEIREGNGVLAAICLCCLERAFTYEMDRDGSWVCLCFEERSELTVVVP
jgi:hypothetical protein